MKKRIYILIGFIICLRLNTFSQKRVMTLTKINSNKQIIFEEGQRIRVKLEKGTKHAGRILFVNDTLISLKSELIHIKGIKKIKKNPLLITIPSSIVSVSVIGSGFYFAINSKDSDIFSYMGIGAAGVLMAFFLPPNPLKAYKKSEYKIKINNE